MPNNKLDFDAVREIAINLGAIEESSIHGAPSIKVRGKLFACPALHKFADPDAFVVRIDPNERAQLISEKPGRLLSDKPLCQLPDGSSSPVATESEIVAGSFRTRMAVLECEDKQEYSQGSTARRDSQEEIEVLIKGENLLGEPITARINSQHPSLHFKRMKEP